MTDPIDSDGSRDDDFDWERGEERPSTRDQLSRLRDGMSRDGVSRGGRRRGGEDDPASGDPSGADLPGSLDRAIARVGGLLDDVGSASESRGVRDPYADFGDQAPPERADQGYETAYSEPPRERPDYSDDADREARPERARRERPRRAESPRGFDEDPAERGGRRSGAERRERRAARSRKTGYSYDDSLGRPEPDLYEAESLDPASRPEEPRRAEPRPPESRQQAPRQQRPRQQQPRQDDPLEEEVYRDAPPRRRGAPDAGWDDEPPAPRRGRRSARDERAHDHRGLEARAPAEEEYEPRDLPARREKPRRSKKKRDSGVMDAEEAAAQAEATRGRGSAPFGALERMLAGRYLRARRKEGFISVIAMLSLIGITLAVAVLIVVMSVMNGFRAELISKIVGVNGHLIVQPFDRNFEGYDDTARKIRTVPGVTRAAPMIESQAFATSPRGGSGVLVRGLSKTDLLSLEKVSVSPESSIGSLANFGAIDGIALGDGLARKLGVSVGDTINVISPQGSVTPFGVAPKRRAFEVLYVFKMGMSNYDEALMFMPIDDAQSFFNRPGRADFIEVQVATPDQLEGYADDIRATAGDTLTVRSWMDNNQVFIGALETEQSVMFLILSMLILIASLIIISGLIMLVKEKGPDIAILRTMGLSRGGVMRVFFMCGATIGLIGTIVGVTLGVIVALNVHDIKVFIEEATGAVLFPEDVYLFSKMPSRLDWNDVGFTIMITLGLSFVATLYPARRAARMDPVEALRYE